MRENKLNSKVWTASGGLGRLVNDLALGCIVHLDAASGHYCI